MKRLDFLTTQNATKTCKACEGMFLRLMHKHYSYSLVKLQKKAEK